jgi:hypothetical protein
MICWSLTTETTLSDNGYATAVLSSLAHRILYPCLMGMTIWPCYRVASRRHRRRHPTRPHEPHWRANS